MRVLALSRLDAPATVPPAPDDAPRTFIEAELVKLWAEVFGRPHVGRQADFFDLGGDSLRAATLMARIEAVLGVALPFSTVYHHPTVAQLAAQLDAQPTTGTALVPLQPEGTRPPFYCVHGLHGHVIPLRGLAAALSRDQPFYGLQAVGPGGPLDPGLPVEAVAAAYVAALRAHQPAGPYYLGGYSSGGIVAYEMARQLVAQGAAVGLLVLLDSVAPAPAQPRWAEQLRFVRWRLRMLGKRLRREGADLRTGRAYLARTQARLARLRTRVRSGPVPATTAHTGMTPAFQEVLRRWKQSFRAYRTRPLAVPTVLFRTDRNLQRDVRGEALTRWDVLIRSGLTVVRVEGTHRSMLQAPHTGPLAAQLEAALRRAQQAAAPPRP